MNDKEYLRKLQADAAASAKKVYGDKSNREKMGKEDRGDKPPFDATTFLYIRAFDGDSGARPIPGGIVFWLSPDVELFSSAGVRIVTTDINTSENYTVQVTVNNDGDQNCNACMVELYLDDPSIGFSVIASTLLGSQTIAVNAHSSATADFPFSATGTMAGHKCLFARAYSFLSNELPLDFVAFNTVDDRHLGQQNLNIVKQASVIDFNLHLAIHELNTSYSLVLKTERKVIRQLSKNILANYTVIPKAVNTEGFKFLKNTGPVTRLDLGVMHGFNILAKPNISPSFIAAAPALMALHETLNQEIKPIVKRRIKTWNNVFDKEFNKLSLQIPDLGLNAGEATPLNLWIKDEKSGKVVGGITLLVTG
ncbi:MAG: CARDB domain-containing protein [Bacteroidota bacterium]